MLLWIAYIDDFYKIHAALKASNVKYLKRIDWRPEEQRYKDAKFIHKWHPTLD
jgi:hypothetical protein